ncbi:MAG TPA: zf-TFIIB domain-containing protein [Usitatibacter sp.]|jgi:hypothetical protein|nr:zf-TFIIB domain-containing protein [Usitatibacter sp.]
MTQPGRACPGCGRAMQRGDFEHRAGGRVEIEACLDCRGIWFDAYESAQLAPVAVMALFRMIQAARERPARPLAPSLHCPACRRGLAFTHDVQGTTHFTYYRCEAGDGRFTLFLQFLREKAFVRSLSPAEITHLRATVGQVRCTSCGATVDLTTAASCPYCGAPFAVLDAEAVGHALDRAVTSAAPVGLHGNVDLVGDAIDLILPGDPP